MSDSLPIVVSIPHGGDQVPPEVAPFDALDPADRFRDADACTLDIYDLGADVAGVVSTEIARAYVDVNRAPDDRPPANPDGVVKTRTSYDVPVYARPLEADLVELLIARYHTPYHARIRASVTESGARLVLDCHSMAEHPPPSATDVRARPAMCISNASGRTCPADLFDTIARSLGATFDLTSDDVRRNDPFRGGFITRHHGEGGIPVVQVEMNRRLYLHEPWFDPDRLTVDADRLAELRARFAAAAERIAAAL